MMSTSGATVSGAMGGSREVRAGGRPRARVARPDLRDGRLDLLQLLEQLGALVHLLTRALFTPHLSHSGR